MIYSVDFESLAGRINHLETAKYLRDLGWAEVPTKANHVNIFQLENQALSFQVNLPASRDLRDYGSAMFRTAETIALSANKSVEHVILELLNPLSDILRIRIQEPSAETGSLFVEDAIRLYENAKKLLMFAAMDVERPQPFHAGRPNANISEFIGMCRFGQTEIGSYIVSVVCPFAYFDNSPSRQLSYFSDAEVCADTLTRKTMNKLISSVHTVKKAVHQGNLESITENSISANFLDALSKINIYRTDSTLDLTVKYAPTININTLSDTSVSINHDYYRPIDSVVQKIKHTHENQEKAFIGLIKASDADPNVSLRKQGTIRLVYLNNEGKSSTSTATVNLAINDYNAALDAHSAGKYVKVVGILSGQKGNRSIEYSHFEVL